MPRLEEFDDVQLDVEFTQAGTRSNLTSKENIAISFGKISKWYEALVPTGGSSGQFLAWNSSGTAKWVANPNVDTKVTSTLLAQSTAAATYLPTFVSAAGNGGVNIMNSFSFGHTVGTTSAVGNSRIVLGNATASGTANNEEGEIILYSSGTSYHTIKGSATASAVTHSLPTTGGIILNTGTTSFTQTLSSGTKIGSIKINGTSTDIYAPTNTNTTYSLTQDSTDGHKIALTPSSGNAQTITIPDNNTTYSLSGAYGSSSNTWVTTLTPSSGTATTSTVPAASTSVYGITKLSSATNSTSTALAATPSAVKSAYDLANGKSTVSFSASLTSGTKVGTITINGTGTDIYCETNTNTDTKVTDTVGTANTYYPAGGTSTSTSTGTQVFDTSLKFIGTTGTTSAVGKAQLVLGNSTASGTANNKQGSIVVYGSTAYPHTIQGAPTAARTLTLPDKAGTFALTSDIPSVPTVNDAALTLKGAGTTVTTFTANSSSAKSLDIVAGSNVTVTADATNAKISIASSHPTITKSTDTTSTASPAHGGTFTTVDSVTRDGNGHVTKINTKTVTLPADSNTDTKVRQSQTATTNYRPILFGAKNSTDVSTLADTITDEAYTSTKLYAQPSTGLIYCTGRKIENVTIQTGSTKVAHITLQTLMTWLITTKTYIPSGQYCHVIISTTWAYANNDILQVNIDGANYEIQLAGVIIEFIGSATSYNAGVFRLLIHSSPTINFTATSGYSKFPVSTIAEYTCNGSDYSPTWKKIWNSHPTYTSKSSGLYKITVDGTGHVSATASVAKGDIPALDYLPLSGGTMTGDITFASISGDTYPISSKGIKWGGGTDAIDMYYNLRESDAGELIINMRDDSNVRISFAYNGTVKSYIDTNGTYNGNASTATKLGTANKGSTTKGIYLDAGVPKEMTYSLGSTVNAGTANQLAYYSGANAISATHDGTNTNDSLYFKTGTNAKSARQIILGIYGQTYGNDASTLISGTAGVFSYGDGGPQIDFNTSSSGSQAGALIFTDHDTAGAGASWHFVSNQSDWNVTSKRFHARTSISIGTATPNTSYNLYVNGTTNITGAATIGGTLVLSKTQDASGTTNNSPALIVGGAATSTHLELDANEIMAKTNGTSTASLYINNDGGNVYINNNLAARHTATPASGQVVITDGTAGGIKSSGYTIAKSVPSDAKFTDTVTTVTTSGSGNAVTSITASNGALTVTKGTTFLNKFNSSSTLNQFSGAPTYLLGIEAFGSSTNGEVKWQSASSCNVGHATSSDYLNIVASNEIRFSGKPSSAISLWFAYKWADGTSSALINDYLFGNGNAGYANVKAKGFVKDGSSDSYVLLGGGGHKAISDFATSGHTHNYAGSDTVGGVANNSYYLGDSTAPSTYKLRYINSNDTTTWTTSSLAATDSIAVIRGSVTGAWTTGHIVTFNVASVGTPFQLGIHDSNELYFYKRYKTGTDTWSEWTKMNAGNADVLNYNNSVTATTSGLQYTHGSIAIGTSDGNSKEGSDPSYKLWSYPAGGTEANSTIANIQNLRLYWTSAYFRDIFLSPNNDRIYHRAVINNSAKPWYVLLDSNNLETYSLHTPDTAKALSGGTERNMGPITRPQNLYNRSNKLALIPGSNITVEYSTDAGSNWADMGLTADKKGDLFNDTISATIPIGPNNSTDRTTSMQTRITITCDGRDQEIDQYILRLDSSYQTISIDLQVAYGNATTTFTNIRTGLSCPPWIYQYILNTETKRFSTGTTSAYVNKIRFIIKYTTINSSHKTSKALIHSIAGYGGIYWGGAAKNNLMIYDHLYTWDNSQNATFPAQLSATGATFTSSSFGPLKIVRSGSTNAAGIKFYNNTSTYLGSLGINTANSRFLRWDTNDSTSYEIIDRSVVRNNTVLGTLGWTSSSADTVIPTVNTIAFWNGAYSGTSSNLAYCNKGAFGTIVTKSTTDYSKVSISRNLTSGTKVGTITIDGTATDLYCETNTTNANQTNTTTNADYRVLFSTNANDTTQSGTTRKNINLKYNPSTATLKIGDYVSGSTATKTGKLVLGNSSNVYTHTINTNADKLSNVSLTLNSTDGIMGTDTLCYKGYEGANLASDTAPGTLADISSLSNAVSFSGYLARFSYFTVLLCVGTDVTARTTVQVSAIAGYQSYQLIWGGAPNHSGGNLSITSGLVNISESSGTITLNFGKCASYWQFSSSSSNPTKGTTPDIHVLKVYGHSIRSNGYH